MKTKSEILRERGIKAIVKSYNSLYNAFERQKETCPHYEYVMSVLSADGAVAGGDMCHHHKRQGKICHITFCPLGRE